MVGTILPIVYRERQQKNSSSALWFYAAGCLVGGVCLGGLLGAIGTSIPWQALSIRQRSVVLAVSGFLGLLYSIRELGLWRVPILQSTWQVPEIWRRVLSPQAASLLYGLGLGVGIATRVPVSTFYITVVWATLVGNPILGGIGMAMFGLGRAFPILWMGRLLNSSEEAVRLIQILPRWQPTIHMTNGLALGFTGSCFLVAGVILN
jgi:sulfite exporter TauE/SafE